MREELLTYYEEELTYLRRMGAEFARKYPKIASRLQLEPERCEDPHVERLLEGFALLAARVHLKIDDDFPQITNALLATVYPHFLRPIPSMSIAELALDPEQGKPSTGTPVPRGTLLYSREVEGVPCKFRTCYDVTLWPLNVLEANWTTPDRLSPPVRVADTVGVVRLVLRCNPDVTFDKLGARSLRFYLNGETNLVHTLYELLCNNCTQIMVRDLSQRGKAPLLLDASRLIPAGFGENEGMLPFSRRSFQGYQLLQEYFLFPEKFFFLDLHGMDEIGAAGFKDHVEVLFLISRFERQDRSQLLEVGLSSASFRLGCTPIINLFPQTAEPILLDKKSFQYPVVPDVRRQHVMEVFSLEEVLATRAETQEIEKYEPFFSYHDASSRDKNRVYWHATRRSSGFRNDERTELDLWFADQSGKPIQPQADVITLRCTCSNYTLPSRLPFGNPAGDFQLEGASAIRKIVCLRKPTDTVRPPSEQDAFWRLTSHLSLNYLSLVNEGKDALKQLLQTYNFSNSIYVHNQISGITDLRSKRHFARLASEGGIITARGTRVEMQLDEEQFVGGGVFLFAAILERFLGMYVSMNSFTQLVATTQQRKEVLREWPPRAGQSILI
ncbi:MAG TPA: type VI secretion system baseplate subunit TssF [Terriglobales bacterium]|nr:type VI secretion system baseplate subunit TssF [Terriglobales bacterium]